VRIFEDLLEWKVAARIQKTRIMYRGVPPCWSRNTIVSAKACTKNSPSNGSHSVGIFRLRTKSHRRGMSSVALYRLSLIRPWKLPGRWRSWIRHKSHAVFCLLFCFFMWHETCGRGWCVGRGFLGLGTSLWWVVSFTSLRLYPEKWPWARPQRRLGRHGEEIILEPQRIELQSLIVRP
jgi:hypothetical protein